MNEDEKIQKINEVVGCFFADPKNPREIPAKDLMPQFIENGIFSKDSKNGFPIRKLLRKLDEQNALWRIPYVHADRKTVNINWYFEALSPRSLRPIPFSDSSKVTAVFSKNVSESDRKPKRLFSDEYYVIELCNEVLGKRASQQHKFDFLRGDTGCKLPVDAYYEELNLVVEYCEHQHIESVSFFDRRMTASGVSRGEQRKIYDQRRRDELRLHEIHLVEIYYSDFGNTKRLKRDRIHDIEVVKKKLKSFI